MTTKSASTPSIVGLVVSASTAYFLASKDVSTTVTLSINPLSLRDARTLRWFWPHRPHPSKATLSTCNPLDTQSSALLSSSVSEDSEISDSECD